MFFLVNLIRDPDYKGDLTNSILKCLSSEIAQLAALSHLNKIIQELLSSYKMTSMKIFRIAAEHLFAYYKSKIKDLSVVSNFENQPSQSSLGNRQLF